MRWTIDQWARDLRHSLRALLRSPGFTLMAVGTLGLAIGVNAGMFSVVNKVLLDPLPYGNADRLLYVAASAPGSDLPKEFGVSAEFFLQYKEQSHLLEDVAAFNSFTSTMRAGDRVERIRMSAPTYTLFSTLGAQPLHGRLPRAEDEDRVVLISYALWQSWFGGDVSVLNKSFYISGTNREVIGIMGPDFRFPVDGTMLWISSQIRPEGLVPGRFGMPLVARMAPGATAEAVAGELNTLAKRLPERFGGSAAYARTISQHRAVVRSLEEQLLGELTRPLWVLFGAVGIVLLIACANVANLFLVRAEGRQRDLAIRRAIGAGRGQLIRLQMAEAAIVALLAGGLAVLIAYLALPVFLQSAPPGIPRLGDVRITGLTLLFTLGAAILSALACGMTPAIRASSPSFARLRDGNRGSTLRHHWARNALVAGQTALALVLLIGAGLLIRSFVAMSRVDPGYSTRDLFTFQIAPEGPHLPDGPAYARFSFDFMDRLRALPGVETVGLVENIPLNESTATVRFRTETSTTEADTGKLLHATFTAGDYFKAMNIDLLAGRIFDTNDHLSALPNVIVSKSAAAALWPGQNAIGKRVMRQGLNVWDTVVGVVDDVMQDNFRDSPEAVVYFPLVGPTPTSWVISSPAYVIKSPRAETIAPEVLAIVRKVAPEAPMYRLYTMAGLVRETTMGVSFMMLTLGVASALALILGAVGLYGVLSYVVAERTREIGVRMALGARAEQVRRMVVGQGTRVVGIGVAIGLLAALWLTQALGSLLFHVAPVDAPTFIVMSLSMIAVGLLASYLPARRASKVDPIVSLRGE